MISFIKTSPNISGNEVIWRYMDFASFYSLVSTRGLFFRRLDKYPDQFEGALPEETKKYVFDNMAWMFDSKTPGESIARFTSHLMEFNTGTLSNSWVASPEEQYAMWKLCLKGNTEGIAIRTTVDKLCKVLNGLPQQFHIGKVNYGPLTIAETDYTTLAICKSSAYSYEHELRVLLYNQFEKESVPLYDMGGTFQVNIDELIDDIYISPFAGHWFQDVIANVTRSFMPRFNPDHIRNSRMKGTAIVTPHGILQ
jgi:hypothetical protein